MDVHLSTQCSTIFGPTPKIKFPSAHTRPPHKQTNKYTQIMLRGKRTPQKNLRKMSQHSWLITTDRDRHCGGRNQERDGESGREKERRTDRHAQDKDSEKNETVKREAV